MNLVWPGNSSGAETWRDESGRGKRGLVAGAVLYLPLFRMFVFISEDFYSINVVLYHRYLYIRIFSIYHMVYNINPSTLSSIIQYRSWTRV